MLERELQRFLILLLGGRGYTASLISYYFCKKASSNAAAAESALGQHSSRQPPWQRRKTRPSNDVHRLRKVPQRVEGEPCSMLHGLCLPSLPTPRCAPSLSLSSLSLRLCSGGAPLSPPVDFYVMVYLPLSWCSGSKNRQGRLRRKQRAVVPNVDFTSSAGCMLGLARMHRVK